jgi:ketosteroid isomerase-like protein
MLSPEDKSFQQLHDLFGSLLEGRSEDFQAGCADDLVLNVRGSARVATMVPKDRISEWHRSAQQVAGGRMRSSVCFILTTGPAKIVVLTHVIDRNGESYRYESVNHCTLREGLLAGWFSYPMDAADYARAWDLQSQPASGSPSEARNAPIRATS